MIASVEVTVAPMPVLAPTDCGLCTHPAHSIRECPATNEFGQCCCWWYVPAPEYAARCAA